MGGTSHTQKDAQTREDIAKFWFTEFQSRTRVYPQDIANPITLTPNALSNIFGAWTQIIPAGTVPFPYHVHALQTMGVGGADSFFIQLATSATPSGAQMLGEKSFTLGAAGRARVEFHSPTVPLATPIYGRVKTAAGANTIDVSLSVVRCTCTPDIVALIAARRTSWPW